MRRRRSPCSSLSIHAHTAYCPAPGGLLACTHAGAAGVMHAEGTVRGRRVRLDSATAGPLPSSLENLYTGVTGPNSSSWNMRMSTLPPASPGYGVGRVGGVSPCGGGGWVGGRVGVGGEDPQRAGGHTQVERFGPAPMREEPKPQQPQERGFQGRGSVCRAGNACSRHADAVREAAAPAGRP